MLKPILFNSPNLKKYRTVLLATSILLGTTQEGSELLELQLTLIITHLYLVSQGYIIIKAIKELLNLDNNQYKGTYSALIVQLLGLFNLVIEFVSALLIVHRLNNSVAYWAKQTFKAVQRIEKCTQVLGLVPSKAIKPSQATITSRPHPGIAREGLALCQVKVYITNIIECQVLQTILNNIILQRVLQGAKGTEVVGVKKLLSRDVIIQTKDRAGRESLVQYSAQLEGITSSIQVITDLYLVIVYSCCLSNVKTID